MSQLHPSKKPKPVSINISVQNDGTCIVPRGTSHQNQIICELLDGVADLEGLYDFFALRENSEMIFGDSDLCG